MLDGKGSNLAEQSSTVMKFAENFKSLTPQESIYVEKILEAAETASEEGKSLREFFIKSRSAFGGWAFYHTARTLRASKIVPTDSGFLKLLKEEHSMDTKEKPKVQVRIRKVEDCLPFFKKISQTLIQSIPRHKGESTVRAYIDLDFLEQQVKRGVMDVPAFMQATRQMCQLLALLESPAQHVNTQKFLAGLESQEHKDVLVLMTNVFQFSIEAIFILKDQLQTAMCQFVPEGPLREKEAQAFNEFVATTSSQLRSTHDFLKSHAGSNLNALKVGVLMAFICPEDPSGRIFSKMEDLPEPLRLDFAKILVFQGYIHNLAAMALAVCLLGDTMLKEMPPEFFLDFFSGLKYMDGSTSDYQKRIREVFHTYNLEWTQDLMDQLYGITSSQGAAFKVFLKRLRKEMVNALRGQRVFKREALGETPQSLSQVAELAQELCGRIFPFLDDHFSIYGKLYDI